jgi:hypothetical protein
VTLSATHYFSVTCVEMDRSQPVCLRRQFPCPPAAWNKRLPSPASAIPSNLSATNTTHDLAALLPGKFGDRRFRGGTRS